MPVTPKSTPRSPLVLVPLALAVASCSSMAITSGVPHCPPSQTEPTEYEKLTGASMEVNVEPTYFVGANAPPGLAYVTTFRLTGAIGGFDIGGVNRVGLPGDTAEPLGSNGAMIPATSTRTSAFVLGGSFLHYSLELVHSGSSHLYLVLPEADLRLMWSFANVPSSDGTSGGLVIAPGASLLGLRYAHCIGGLWSWVAEVRGPTAFLYLPLMYGGDTANPYGSLGFAGSTGFAF